jgi:hypothetical protein
VRHFQQRLAVDPGHGRACLPGEVGGDNVSHQV